jgi:hypothetical protein
MSRLVEAWRRFTATMPSEALMLSGDGHVTSPDRREALADALLGVCQAVPEGEFD